MRIVVVYAVLVCADVVLEVIGYFFRKSVGYLGMSGRGLLECLLVVLCLSLSSL